VQNKTSVGVHTDAYICSNDSTLLVALNL
jgi:hypothetical protein